MSMSAPDIAELLEKAAPSPGAELDMDKIHQRARRRSRRRHGIFAGASLLVIGMVIGGLAIVVPEPPVRQTVATGPLASRPIPLNVDDGVARMGIGLLDGTRLRVTMPEVAAMALKGATFGDLELSGSVYADWAAGRGWRIDAAVGSVAELVAGGEPLPVPGSPATAAVVDQSTHRLGLQFGPWAVIASGDSLDGTDIETLNAGLDFAQSPEGFVEYRGSLPLWVVDGPDAAIRQGGVTVLVHLPTGSDRECAGLIERRTATGLVERDDPPAPSPNMSRLCEPVHKIRLTLITERPLTDGEIDEVDLDVLSVGPTLSALKKGPGAQPVDGRS